MARSMCVYFILLCLQSALAVKILGGNTPSPKTFSDAAADERNTVSLASPTASPTLAPASVIGDPHVHNLKNEAFDIRKPSEYELLRVPADPRLPAAMLLSAVMAAGSDNPCGVYMKQVTFRGSWFGGQTLSVRPRTRNEAGSNSAGNETFTNFSLRVSGEQWRSFSSADAGSIIGDVSTDHVQAKFVMREQFRARVEGQALEFRVGQGRQAVIVVSQAAHQALNLEMSNLVKLGENRLGGLLGTEGHDKEAEEATEECKAKSADAMLSNLLGGSRQAPMMLKASWV